MTDTSTSSLLPPNSLTEEISAALEAQRTTAAVGADPEVHPPTVPPEVLPKTGADAIVAHCADAVGEVHQYTIDMLDTLAQYASDLKNKVENERAATVARMENYVALANDTLKAAEKIKGLLGQIEESIEKGHA